MIRHFIVALVTSLLISACATPAQSTENTESEAPSTTPAAPPAVAQSAEPDQAGEAPTDPEVMYRVFAAELLGSEGDLEGAVGEYLEAAMESDDPAIAMRATRVAFAAQAWQQASMAADRWALLDPESLPARESAALSMLATADYAGAEIQMGEIIELSEDKEAAWSMISGLLARSVAPDKAMKVLDNLLEKAGDEGSAGGLFAQSQLAVRAGEMADAYELARRAAKIRPDQVEYLSWAGRLALTQDDSEGAMNFMHAAWELNPEDHDLTLAYADLLARDGQQDAARKLMADMEQAPDVVLTRILFELSSNDVPQAFSLYESFKEMTFDDPNAKAFYLARAAESLDQLQEAIDFYGGIKEGEYYLQSTARMAELLAMQGDMQGARNALSALRLQPDQEIVEQSWLTEARIFQQTGDREGALSILGQALEQFGSSIPIRYAHGLLAAEMGMIEVAETDLRLILVEQPDHVMSLNALGYTLADQTDRYVEAEELIGRAYSLQPNDASITDSMGWVAYRLGRFNEAVEHLNRAWSLDSNPEIAAHLGEVLWQQGKYDEAQAVWQKGMAVNEGNKTLIETMKRLDPEP
jgi:tetratricopeptide (TPR) repeat protein